MEENNNQAKHKNQVSLVLEEYFAGRVALPEHNTADTNYQREDKTTQEIQDDLATVMYLTFDEINDFMFFHDYKLAIQADGTLKWAIWRNYSLGADKALLPPPL